MISYGGETIVKVVSLPDTEDYRTPEGNHVDIGYLYKSVSIFYVPVWNYDGRLVGLISGEDSYLNITPDQISVIAHLAGITIPAGPYLDFWQRIGGKIVFVIGLVLFGLRLRNKSIIQGAYLSPLATANERLKDILLTGQNFVATKTYLTSFITVSLFDMTKLSVAAHYMYFVFSESPSADEMKLLLKLKKKKLLKGASSVPAVIDLEKEEVHLSAGANPSKKVVEKCFIQQVFEAEPAAETNILK